MSDAASDADSGRVDAAPEAAAVDASSSVSVDLGTDWETVAASLFADPSRWTDELFQLLVETGGAPIPKESPLWAALGEIDAPWFAGHWPDAWVHVRRVDRNVALSVTSEIWRWRGDHFEEVLALRKPGHVAYAFGSWTHRRIAMFRGELRGGNQQAFVVPKLEALSSTGRAQGGVRSAKGFIADRVRAAPSGELFVAGRTPPSSVGDAYSVRPAIARFNKAAMLVSVDLLPTEHQKQSGVWTSTAHVANVCVVSATRAVAVGSEERDRPGEGPTPAVWDWDGKRWTLSKPNTSRPMKHILCTPDGGVWIHSGSVLERQPPDARSVSLAEEPETLVATVRSDVFGERQGVWFRLRR